MRATKKPQQTGISVPDLARRWGMCTKTIKRKIAAGVLTTFAVGRSVRVRMDKVIEIENRCAASARGERSGS